MTDVRDLAHDACWAHLRTVDLGRLAVTIDGRPDIFPVNFVVDHGTVVFRTAEGTKLAAASVRPAVAFEADGLDPDSGEAWSVVIKGRAEEIRGLHALVDTDGLPLYPQHPTRKSRFVRIVPDELTGRRFGTVPRETWFSPLHGARRAPHE